MSHIRISGLGLFLLAGAGLGLSSCGRVELGGSPGKAQDRRSAPLADDGSAAAIELAGKSAFHKGQMDPACDNLPSNDKNPDIGTESVPPAPSSKQASLTGGNSGQNSKGHGSAGGYGTPKCPAKPTPPAPPVNPPLPPMPPLPPVQPPSSGKGPLVDMLTGLVCKKSPDALFNIAQFVGSQSKDQLQFLVNADVTGKLTIDTLVEYGKIAKGLTVEQITLWKTRICAGSNPIGQCTASTIPVPTTKEDPNLGKGGSPQIPLPPNPCLPQLPAGTVVSDDPASLDPLPSVDSAGKDQT